MRLHRLEKWVLLLLALMLLAVVRVEAGVEELYGRPVPYSAFRSITVAKLPDMPQTVVLIQSEGPLFAGARGVLLQAATTVEKRWHEIVGTLRGLLNDE